jgi:hypothetical protein
MIAFLGRIGKDPERKGLLTTCELSRRQSEIPYIALPTDMIWHNL